MSIRYYRIRLIRTVSIYGLERRSRCDIDTTETIRRCFSAGAIAEILPVGPIIKIGAMQNCQLPGFYISQ